MDSNKSKILVVCDGNKKLNKHMLQIVSKAKNLADQSNHELYAFFGEKLTLDSEEEFRRQGVNKVLYVDKNTKSNMWEYADLLSEVIEKEKPRVILFQATDYGKNLAALISAKFEAGLTADCIDVVYNEEEGFAFIRAAMCDSVIAQIKCINCEIHMGTVKEDVFVLNGTENKDGIKKEEVDSSKVHYEENISCLQVEALKQQLNEINLGQYSILFCIGRGASKPECVEAIYELAEKYNAGVICTRPVVEDGIMERARQVGQSGKSVAPQIYVGFGVSGASQHLVGIRNAQTIIAVNSDPKAPIFDYADYAVVGNVEEILQQLKKIDENKVA